ncbi:MAG: hypothetical protein AAB913_03380 [Patescibacteria group bacterium]
MKVAIPIGSEINITDNKSIKIKIPNTEFWVVGERNPDGTWNAYLIDPQSNYKELFKKNYSTKAFALFSSTILKTPFPYYG